MYKITNLDNKRVCDCSNDYKTIVIRRKDCITIIHVDGKIKIENTRIKNKLFHESARRQETLY